MKLNQTHNWIYFLQGLIKYRCILHCRHWLYCLNTCNPEDKNLLRKHNFHCVRSIRLRKRVKVHLDSLKIMWQDCTKTHSTHTVTQKPWACVHLLDWFIKITVSCKLLCITFRWWLRFCNFRKLTRSQSTCDINLVTETEKTCTKPERNGERLKECVQTARTKRKKSLFGASV